MKKKHIILVFFPLVVSLLIAIKTPNLEKTLATIQPKIVLDNTNTPSEADYRVNWWSENIYVKYRYTEFHYKYIEKNSKSHVILANYGTGGLLENIQPILYPYTITFKLSSSYWSKVDIKTSNDYGIYTTKESIILNGSIKTITFTTDNPYFTIHKSDGAMVNLEYIFISYYC